MADTAECPADQKESQLGLAHVELGHIESRQALDLHPEYAKRYGEEEGPFSVDEQALSAGDTLLTRHGKRFCIARVHAVVHRHDPQFIIAAFDDHIWRVRTAVCLAKTTTPSEAIT